MQVSFKTVRYLAIASFVAFAILVIYLVATNPG